MIYLKAILVTSLIMTPVLFALYCITLEKLEKPRRK